MQQVFQQEEQSQQNLPRNVYKNAIIVKNEIGRSKQSMYNLPNDEFIFGKSSGNQQNKPQFQISEWSYPQQSASKQPPRDFLVMNRKAIKDKIINPKGQSDYRKQNEVRQQLKEGKKYQQINLPENQFSYGVPNKPSTPINRIIQQEYANETEQQYLQEYEYKMKKIQQEKKEKQQFFINKSHDTSVKAAGVYHKKPIENAERLYKIKNFKLNKFKEIGPKISKDDIFNAKYVKSKQSSDRYRNKSVLPQINRNKQSVFENGCNEDNDHEQYQNQNQKSQQQQQQQQQLNQGQQQQIVQAYC